MHDLCNCRPRFNVLPQVVPPAAGNVTQSSSLDLLVRNPRGSARQQLIVFESQLTSVIAGSLGLQGGEVGGVAWQGWARMHFGDHGGIPQGKKWLEFEARSGEGGWCGRGGAWSSGQGW